MLAREIKDMCPGKALLESSKVLVDAALRATLLKESAAINSSKLLTVAGEILQMLTKYKDESVTKHLKGGQDALFAARRHGRVCVAVSWAISEITNLTTTALSPDDMVSGAELIKEKLRIKGFGIHQASSKCDVYQHQSVYTHGGLWVELATKIWDHFSRAEHHVESDSDTPGNWLCTKMPYPAKHS